MLYLCIVKANGKMKKENAYELTSRLAEIEEEKKSVTERLEKAVLTVIDEEAEKNPTKPVWESGSAKMFLVMKSDLIGGAWSVGGCVWTEAAEVLKEIVKRSGPVAAIGRFGNILSKSKNGVCTVEFKGGSPSKWWTRYSYTKTIDERYLKAVFERLTKSC